MKNQQEEFDFELATAIINKGLLCATHVLLNEHSRNVIGYTYEELTNDKRYEFIKKFLKNKKDINSPYAPVYQSLYLNMILILYAYMHTPISVNEVDDIFRAADFVIKNKRIDYQEA